MRRELATGRDLNVDVDTIVNSTRTKKTHRFIDVTITSATAEDGKEIAELDQPHPERLGAPGDLLESAHGLQHADDGDHVRPIRTAPIRSLV